MSKKETNVNDDGLRLRISLLEIPEVDVRLSDVEDTKRL